MPKTKKLITVPEQNEHYKGTEFKRWDSLLATFNATHPDHGIKPSANSKSKRDRKNDR